MVKKILKFRSLLIILLFAFFLFLVLLPLYRDNAIILGGEGSYYTDFILLAKNYGYSWYESGTGIFALSLNYVFHLMFLQFFISNERVINFFMIYFMYFLPLVGCYAVCRAFGLRIIQSIIVSGFYLFNPFTANFLKSINQWNMFASFILPIYFFIIFKFFDKERWLFFLFGLISLIFSFANANPPTMVIYHIGIFAFVFLTIIYKYNYFKVKLFIRKLLIVELSFIFFNLWWLANTVYVFFDAQSGYSTNLAISWLRDGKSTTPVIWRALTLSGILQYPLNPDYDFFSKYISSPTSQALIGIPIILIISYLFIKKNRDYFLYLSLFFLITVFLSKGAKGMFGGIYEQMITKLPLFQMFKSAPEKWGILLVFFMTLIIIIVFKEIIKTKFYNIFFIGLLLYTICNATPFITGNFIPDYKYNNDINGSRKFSYKQEYQDLRNILNFDNNQSRVLSLPGSNNYQIALQIEGNKYYTGNDPILSNINKPFISPYNGTFTTRYPQLFLQISQPGYLNLLGLYNIGKIVINKDVYPWFGFSENEPYPVVENILDKYLVSQKNKVYDLYDSGEYFLPRFYVPDRIVYAPDSTQQDILSIINSQKLNNNNVFFVTKKDQPYEDSKQNKSLMSSISSDLVLTGVTQSSVSEEKLKQQANGIDKGGVLFAYARWKPGGIIYPYIQKKEDQQIVNAQNDLIEYYKINIFLAGKRVTEIQYWDKSFDEESFKSVLGRYTTQMSEALKTLDKISVQDDKAYNYLAQSEVDLAAYNERLRDIIIGDWGADSKRQEEIKTVENELNSQLRNIFLRHFIATKYFFDIPTSANYHLFVQDPNDLSGWSFQNLKANDGEFSDIPITKNDSGQWFDLGESYLKEGNHWFSFEKTNPVNLLNEKWKIDQLQINVGNDNEYDFKNSTIFQEVDVDSGSDYEISMDTKLSDEKILLKVTSSGEIKDISSFYKIPTGDSKGLLYNDVFSSTEGDNYKATFHIPYGVQKIRIAIIFSSKEIAEQTIKLNNLNLYKIIEPKVIISRNINSGFVDKPIINFQKINPTKYIVDVKNVKGPFLLNFSESFHPGWKLFISQPKKDTNPVLTTYLNGKVNELYPEKNFFDHYFYQTWGLTTISDNNHILSNGYANGWWITPQETKGLEDFQLIVEYSGQKYFYFGSILTILVIFISFSLLLMRSVKKEGSVQ